MKREQRGCQAGIGSHIQNVAWLHERCNAIHIPVEQIYEICDVPEVISKVERAEDCCQRVDGVRVIRCKF